VQNLERGHGVDIARFLIAHAGAVRASAVNAEGPPGHRARTEHGIEMRDDQDFSLARAVEHRDEIVRKVGDFGFFRTGPPRPAL